MIVDLCRNDLGRHARYGSVRVEDFAATLRMRNVVHLISRISARLDENRADRVLADLFPAGSITGAPKRRTAQIIGEIEPEIRGPYTGSLGYADLHGNSDWNIAIRTAVWQDRRVHFGCGGGIVLDSDPDLEYEEARWKASSFFDSLRAVISPSSSEPVLSEKEARL
jgi:anthranilate/para-aminobenzoate synthase component I